MSNVVKIKHKYLPYRIVSEFKRGHLCSLRLDNGCFRVVHINSGLTLQEYKSAQSAKALILRISRDTRSNELVGKLTWDDYKNNSPLFLEVTKCVRTHSYSLEIAPYTDDSGNYTKRVILL